jgi:putative transposase
MLRTNTVLLHPSEEQEMELRKLAEASARLWNRANYQRRQTFFGHRRTPSYPFQCSYFKDDPDFKLLGTCKSQALLQKLAEAWASFFELLQLKKKGRLPSHTKKVSPPRYWKDRKAGRLKPKGIFVRNDGYWIDGNVVSVGKDLKIPYTSGALWMGKQGRLEIQHDELSEKWYAHQPVTVEFEARHHNQPRPKRASIDVGVCNLITAIIEGERPIIYSGRAVLSDWVYWTKRIAREQSRLMHLNDRRTSKKLRRLFRARQRRFKHAVYAMLRDLFERLREAGVSELVVGNLIGIRNNSNYSHNVNQKIHNFWSFDTIQKRIKELAGECGITVSTVGESYTSLLCSLCGKKHRNGRIKRGLYYCGTYHKRINADVNGAMNILRKVAAMPAGASGSGLMAQPLLLRWDGCRWEGRSPMSTREMINSEARTIIPEMTGIPHALAVGGRQHPCQNSRQ